MDDIKNYSDFVTEIYNFLEIASSKKFMNIQIDDSEREDGILKLNCSVKDKVFNVHLSDKKKMVITNNSELNVFENIDSSLAVRIIQEKISCGNKVLPKHLKSVFSFIDFPETVKDAVIYPVEITESGTVFEDFNENRYIFSEEAGKLSLFIWKDLYDKEREGEIVGLPEFKEFFIYESLKRADLKKVASEYTDERLMEKNIEMTYGIPSIKECMDSLLPIRFSLNDFLKLGDGYSIVSDKETIVNSFKNFKNELYLKSALKNFYKNQKLSKFLLNEIKSKKAELKMPGYENLIQIKMVAEQLDNGNYNVNFRSDYLFNKDLNKSVSSFRSGKVSKDNMEMLFKGIASSVPSTFNIFRGDTKLDTFYTRLKSINSSFASYVPDSIKSAITVPEVKFAFKRLNSIKVGKISPDGNITCSNEDAYSVSNKDFMVALKECGLPKSASNFDTITIVSY